jgi:hypothetical protein
LKLLLLLLPLLREGATAMKGFVNPQPCIAATAVVGALLRSASAVVRTLQMMMFLRSCAEDALLKAKDTVQSVGHLVLIFQPSSAAAATSVRVINVAR